MANLDTALKRFSGIHVSQPWRGVAQIPDGTVSQRDRQAAAFLYSGILSTSPPTVAIITGTASGGLTEAEVVAGGKTIIITLTNDTWITAGALFNAQRQAIINGLDSAQAETFGWDAVVKALQGVAGVVRTSATVVTITLDAQATYNIAANETITVTVPASALSTSLVAVVATPTFNVTAADESTRSGGGGIEKRRRGSRSAVKPTGLLGKTPKGTKKPPARLDPDARIEESRQIEADVAARLSREFTEDNAARTVALEADRAKAETLARQQIEISVLRAKQLRTEEEQLMLLLLMAANA